MSFMSDFSKTIKIIADQVNPFQSLRTSSLLRLFQDVTVEHTELLGLPRQYTLDKGLLWVVAKQHIEISRMPRYDETICISTFPSKTMHVLFPRTCEIRNEEGELLVKGTSIWALIDIKSRKMINPNDHGISVPDMSNGREFNIPLSNRIPFDLSENGEIKAEYSFCDLNGHINNTSYLDIAENMIPVDFLRTHELTLVDIKYVHEVKLGETLPVKYGLVGDSYYFVNNAFQLELKYRN